MIFKQETVKSWFSGMKSSVNTEIIQPFQNAEQVIWKYNQAIKHNSLTQKGWERLLAQSDDSMRAYLTNIKGTTASMTGYTTSLQGNITGFKKVSSAINQYNVLASAGIQKQNEFSSAVAMTNGQLGNYLRGLNGSKASLGGYVSSLIGATAKTVALQAATMSLNAVVSMGLMTAIQLAIQGFDKLMNSAKRASEAADEAFSESNDKVQQNKAELKSLDELIAKYKELKESGELDVEGRKEVKELQNSIADLVGVQASNLDLVNGKLDDEIKKLDEISAKQAKNAYETATANYNNSKKSVENATGDSSIWFVDGYAYVGEREKEAEKILQDAGFVDYYYRGGRKQTGGRGVGNNGFSTIVFDTYDKEGNELKGAQEKADYLQSMIDVLEQNGQRATDLYAGLIKQRDDYLKYIDDQQNAANSLVNSWLTYSQFSNKELSKINVDSVESFETYRQKMLDEIQTEETIGQMMSEGILSKDDLETAINDFMATSANFSTWYEQWTESLSNGNRIDILSLGNAKLKVVGDEENDIIGLTGEYELLQEVLSDTKDVSIETYEKLTSVSEDYSRALKVEAGRIVVDNQKLKMVNKTRTESIKKEIKEASTLKKLEWIQNAKKLQQYNFQQTDLNEGIWETCDALQAEISQFDILVQGIDAASNAFTAFQEAQDAAQSGDYFDVGLEMADAFQKGLETGKVGTPEFIAAIQGAMDEDLFTEIINMDDAKAQFDAVRKFYEDVYSQYFIEGEDAEYDISGLDNFAKKVASIKDELGNAKYATYDKTGNFAFLESVNIEELAKELKLNAEIVYAILGEMEEYSIGDSFKFEDENFINEQYNKLNAVTDSQKLYNDALENGSKNQQIFAKQMLDTANEEYEEWLQGLGDKILSLEQQWQEQGESNQSFGEYLKNNYSDDEIITMYSTATERAEELRQKMHELEVSGRKGSTEWKNYNAELEKLDDAISAIDNTTEKQELLNEAVQSTKERYERLQEIMESLKDPDLDGESMEKLKQEAYELIAALGQLPKSVEIEFKAKVAELEEKVKTVEEKKSALEKTEVAGYKYSPAYQAQMGEYNAQIRDYNQEIQEINAILHLDVEEARSKIEEMKAEDVDKEGTVTYSPNFDACKRETPPPLVGVVNYEGNFSNIEPPSGGKTSGGGKEYDFSGRPKANGTFNAFATGSQVSIPKNETALVNELGEEGLVRDGKLIPIKGGAQLIDLKRGDIIFNHKQMLDLKKHGYTTGRGKLIGDGGIVGAHFNGTIPAYYDATGSINFKYGTKSVTGSTRDSLDGGKDAKEEKEEEKEITEEFLDWIERRLQKLQHYFDRWFNNAEAMLTKTQMVGGLLAKYYKRASGNLNKQMDVQSQAYGRYMQQADASGLSDEYKKKVQDGLIDIETITDDELKEQISRYQEWYDKANESLAAFEEAANKRFHIPLDKAAKKVEVFGDAIDLLDKKLDNAIGATAKNKLIGDKSDKTSANTMFAEEKKTLNAYKVAKKESAKNLKSQSKKMTSSSILKGSDVSAKEKKNIKKAVKAGKEVDISYFEEGSKAYKQAVKYNEALRANIQATYDAKVAQEEYNSWLVEAAKMKFDNVADDYENKIKQYQNDFTDIDNKIAEIETSGKRINKLFYDQQKALTEQELAQYKAEKVELEKKIKDIKVGTEAWYEAKDAIQEVENSISDCVKKTYELNKASRELYFGIFDDAQMGISRITTEQEFLQGLFAHEKTTDVDTGNFTEAGLAKLGSVSAEYYANEAKKNQSIAELDRLKGLLAKGANADGTWGDSTTTYNSKDELLLDIDKFYDTVRDNTSELYNTATELYDLMEEKYQAELEYVKKLIDDQKEALQREKDLHDYQLSISEKVSNIDVLQKQITAYSGDSSEEGRAKLQRLQKELNSAEKDLNETEYDRYLSDQNDMLDKLVSDYEEAITNQLEDFKAVVNKGLGTANASLGIIETYIKGVANANGYKEENGEIFKESNGGIEENVDNAIDNRNNNVNDTNDNSGVNSSSQNNNTQTSTPQTMPTIPADNTFSSIRPDQIKNEWETKRKEVEAIFGNEKYYAKGKKSKASDYKTKINQYLFEKNGKVLSNDGLKALRKVLGTNNAGLYDVMLELKKHISGHVKNVGGFKTGGIAKLIKSRGEDGLALVRNGEGFIAPEHVDAIKGLMNNLPQMNYIADSIVKLPSIPVRDMGNTVEYGNVSFNIEMNGVNDTKTFAKEFEKAFKSEKIVPKLIQSASIDRLGNNTRLGSRSIK